MVAIYMILGFLLAIAGMFLGAQLVRLSNGDGIIKFGGKYGERCTEPCKRCENEHTSGYTEDTGIEDGS